MAYKFMLPLLLALSSSLVCAQAASYPTRVVRVIVPWPAGGSNDIAARVVMKAVSESTGQSFIIENKAGAGGTIGADGVAKANPDGYTIMVHSGTHISNAFTYPNLPYQTLKDFVPVATIASQALGLAVNQASSARNLKDLMDRARAQPGKVDLSSSGIGSQAHLQIALLEQVTGVQFTHVPYRGGSPQAQAVMGGEVEAGIFAVASIIPAVQAGKVRLLVLTSSSVRSKVFPDVPTMAEAGVKGFDFTPWIGVFAPAATPEPVVSKLQAEIAKALQREDVKNALAAQALDPLPSTREQFAQRLASDYKRYGVIIEATSKQLKER